MSEAAAASGVQRFYRLNGAYDVDTSIGSTSTPGFAEYAQFFSAYRVWSAAVKVHFSASGASAGTPVVVGMYPNSTNTYLINPNTWLTAPMSVSSTITGDGSGGRSVAMISKRYDLPKIARITPQQYRTDMDFSAVVNTTPIRQLQLSVFGVGIQSSTATTIRYNLWVSMDIEFFNPVMLTS